MSITEKTTSTFFALLRAGLWEQSVQLTAFEPLDFDKLYEMADGQSVVGLLAAGLEHVVDRRIIKQEALPFMKKVYSLEGRNQAMNDFIGDLICRLKEAGIKTLLVKGQGVAQCYERPQWRSSGDIDLLLDEDNYQRAKAFLMPLASFSEKELSSRLHLGMTIDSWAVELHGTLRSPMLRKMNRTIDDVQRDTFENGHVRIWRNGEEDVPLPSPDNDIIFIFSHIIQHLFGEGIGLRQICDWCRLLWTYRDSIDLALLESRIREMGLLTEWKTFASFVVANLGMPVEAMPLYDSASCWTRKSRRLKTFILHVGNFGQNRDNSYYQKYPYLVIKTISFLRHLGDTFRRILVFPADSLRAMFRMLITGFDAVAKGE